MSEVNKSIKKIAVFTRYDRLGASSRLRFYQFQHKLQQHGLQCDFFPLFDDEYLRLQYQHKKKSLLLIVSSYLRRFMQLSLILKYDVIWIEKELFPGFPAIFEKLLSRLRPYVADYDDAIFHNYDLSRHFWVRIIFKNKIDKVMQYAKVVVVGSPYLLERAKAALAANVQFIPTVIDEEKYALFTAKIQPAPTPRKDSFVIGWVGSPATQFYLQELSTVFSALQKKYSFLQLHFVGVSSSFAIEGVRHVNIPWSEQTEVASIQKFDVGIMPLKNTPWELGKCGYKLIQFMACGKPVVASRVGANISIVQPNLGFLCDNDSEWIASLSQFIENAQLRAQMGEAALQQVQNKYCIQAVESQLVYIFKNVNQP